MERSPLWSVLRASRTALSPSASTPIDLAGRVRIEVAHQLGGRQDGRRPHAETASGVAWITLALILLGGAQPARVAATGILGVVGLYLGLRSDGGLGRVLWEAVVASSVIARALTSSWPLEASALGLGSVLAGCIAEPIRSTLGQRGAS